MEQLTGALSGARIHDADLTGAEFREVDLSGARFHGAVLVDVDIDGLIDKLVVNGVDVTPYVVSELDRRHPERHLLRSADPAELAQGWAMIGDQWAETTARLRALPVADQNARVDGEWSALETMRHLIFVYDAWFARSVLGLDAFHPMGLASEWVPHRDAMGLADVRPTLAEIQAVRAEQRERVAAFLAAATPDELQRTCTTTAGDAWPVDPTQRTVLACLHCVLDEEWAHLRFCERDLDRLADRAG
jgi:uncharacterized protein YjbI with pentapeptide repeats